AARFLVGGVLEDGVDGLLLGLGDEGAGVDQDDLRLLRLLPHPEALVEQAAEHDLAVHPVLGAAEGEQIYGLAGARFHGGAVLITMQTRRSIILLAVLVACGGKAGPEWVGSWQTTPSPPGSYTAM